MALVKAMPFSFFTAAQVGRAFNSVAENGTIFTGPYGPSGSPGIRFLGTYQDFVQITGATTSGAVCIQQFYVRLSELPSTENALSSVGIGSNGHAFLNVNTSGVLTVRGGPTESGSLLGTSSYTIPLDTWVYIAWKVTIGDSGSVVVHVWEDGDTAAQVVLSVSSVDTQQGVSATWSAYGIGPVCDGTNDFAHYLVMDGSGSTLNDLRAPTHLHTLWASARTAAALSQWTLSSGSTPAWLLDDDQPDDDVTYASESTQNEQLAVAVEAVPYANQTILGAEFYACAKLVSGTPTVEPIGYQDATANLGTSQSPGATYGYVTQPYSAMPDGSAFSTAADFDALQWGLKLTSASSEVRVTQIVVVVIQTPASRRNILVGASHTVTGSDNLIAGVGNEVDGNVSEAHGTGGTVTGDRSILFALDGDAHSETGDGILSVHADEIKVNVGITYPDNVKQTFNPGSTTAGVNVGAVAGDPSTPANGDLWYDSTANELTARINGANVALGSGGGGSGGDSTHTDAYASRPAASNAGDLFLPSDGFVVERDTGAAWVPWGPLFPFTAPVDGDFAWINQGGASVSTTKGGIYLEAPTNASTGWRIRKKSAPSTPYTITAAFILVQFSVSFHRMAMLWRQSSDGKLITAEISFGSAITSNPLLAINKWNSATSHSATVSSVPHLLSVPTPVFLRIADDGTDRTAAISFDGQNFITFYTETRTTFLTADEIGFGLDPNNSTWKMGLTLLSWKES